MSDLTITDTHTPKKIFIGVSWPYSNGPLHLGHLAGQNIVCDVFARYHRLKGNRVLMVSGSDSHGAPVVFKAEELGKTPDQVFEESHAQILEVFKRLGLVYENYTSTHTENHKIVSQNLFNVLRELGYLRPEKSKQYFDEKVGRFLPDRYVRGTCPHCKNENARGDECPECGKYLEPEDLINPYSTLSDSIPVIKETEHFYLDLKRLSPEIEDFIKSNSEHWRTWVREFSLGWIKQGLEPRPITRDMDYGVPVPLDGWDGKVLYVWFEAVIGYLSAAIEWAEKSGNPSAWEDFWKDSETKHYYFIAGGNVPFHTIVWPAELIAYNEKFANTELNNKYRLPGESSDKHLQLPYDVPANNMLLYQGRKMSKGDSTGITVESLLDQYGPDIMRYFFARYAPESQDREYTMEDFIQANDGELVANIGNFINRSLTFTYTKFEGKVPTGTLDASVSEAINTAFHEIGESIENCKFNAATKALLAFGDFANKYFNDEKPWETVKTEPEKAAQTIFNSVQIVSALRMLLKPFTPFAVTALNQILNIEEYDPNIELETKGSVTDLTDRWSYQEIASGYKINQPTILFEKSE